MSEKQIIKKFIFGYLMPGMVALVLPLVRDALVWMSLNKYLFAATSYIAFRVIMSCLFILSFIAFWKNKSFDALVVQMLLLGFILYSLALDSIWTYKEFY